MKEENIFDKKVNVQFNLSKENLVGELQMYAETPSSLINYIQGMWIRPKLTS